jgi:hypothetical protein
MFFAFKQLSIGMPLKTIISKFPSNVHFVSPQQHKETKIVISL